MSESPAPWTPPDQQVARISAIPEASAPYVPDSGYTVPRSVTRDYLRLWGNRVTTGLLALGVPLSIVADMALYVAESRYSLHLPNIHPLVTGGLFGAAYMSNLVRRGREIELNGFEEKKIKHLRLESPDDMLSDYTQTVLSIFDTVDPGGKERTKTRFVERFVTNTVRQTITDLMLSIEPDERRQLGAQIDALGAKRRNPADITAIISAKFSQDQIKEAFGRAAYGGLLGWRMALDRRSSPETREKLATIFQGLQQQMAESGRVR